MFSFYIPSPDFLEVGEAATKEACFDAMCQRANIVYGKIENAYRYAGGIIFDVDLKELLKSIDGWKYPHQYYVRFDSGWEEVSKEIYETYADKFKSEVLKC